MCAVGERLVLQSAPIFRSQQFGTPVRLHPAAHPFSQKAKNVTRYTHSFAICAEDKIREKLDAAKVGVVGVGGLLAFWLLQKSDGGDSGDALQDAKRIMDKYR
ncbi:hypothetical protein WJX75_006294 [Coccomyxa subellipsoidea]|uniref:Uncharacterized protein n=1 Tax=Coccomyxa subellipsoidea TaxID=248742 RepID=A0ABR2YQ61_9CHLO